MAICVLRLFPAASSVRPVRLAVQHACARCELSAEDTQTATLLASEVMTNAVVHGHGMITFAVDCGGGSIAVAVTDEEEALPVRAEGAGLAEGGRGLQLLDALAGAWGSRGGRERKTVWFRVP